MVARPGCPELGCPRDAARFSVLLLRAVRHAASKARGWNLSVVGGGEVTREGRPARAAGRNTAMSREGSTRALVSLPRSTRSLPLRPHIGHEPARPPSPYTHRPQPWGANGFLYRLKHPYYSLFRPVLSPLCQCFQFATRPRLQEAREGVHPVPNRKSLSSSKSSNGTYATKKRSSTTCTWKKRPGLRSMENERSPVSQDEEHWGSTCSRSELE